MKNKLLLTVLVILLIVLIAIYIGIRIYEHTTGLTISHQGSTGDAFNGFVSPFIATVSGILVYMAFREQVKANELLSNNVQLETFNKMLEQIKVQVKALEYTHFVREADAMQHQKIIYEKIGTGYRKTYTGSSAINIFGIALEKNNDIDVDPAKIDFSHEIFLIYEDMILLERYISNAKGEHVKHFYAKLDYYFKLTFEYSFEILYDLLKEDKDKVYYMTIKNMERVRFVLATYQALEHKIFTNSQRQLEQKRKLQEDLDKIRGKK